MNKNMSARAVAAAVALCLSAVCAAAQELPSPSIERFEIKAQSLAEALRIYADQTGEQVVFFSELDTGIRAPEVVGQYTREEALQRLLSRTGLRFERLNDKTIAITDGRTTKSSAGLTRTSLNGIRLSQASGPAESNSETDSASVGTREPSASENGADALRLEEVVVTGSHIRGAKSSASPVFTYDRETIEKTGYVSTHEFIRSLPQAFGGGMSDAAMGGILGGEGANNNSADASAANLRGLGNRATLTLLNGRRLAPASTGDGVDLSIIPLNAVERIEVLTDGASAIYGSDAIGGVVNIILRKGYEGAETSLRYGSVTQGSHGEKEAAQTLGHSWNSGDAIFSYSYYDRSSLSTDERPYMSGSSFAGFDLVPIMKRQNAMLNLRQDMGDRVRWNTDALYSMRDTEYDYVANGTVPVMIESRSTSYGASSGAEIALGRGWQMDVNASYNRSNTRRRALQSGEGAAPIDMMSDVVSVDVKLDGTAFVSPGGEAKLAIGSQYRRDGFDSFGEYSNTGGKDTRSVKGIFAELFVPLLGERNARPGVQRLELSLAGRYEEYSDFGSTSNPKVGLLWAPLESVSLRGTYGTSYRAPQLYELNEQARSPQGVVYTLYDETGAINKPTLVIYGNNRNLRPEEATMWTAGIDIDPEALGGLKVGLTYFDVDYTGRISQPVPDVDFAYVLTKPEEYASAIQFNPSMDEINYWVMRPDFQNLSGAPIETIIAILDQRLTNVSGVKETGLDFNLGYLLDTPVGTFDFHVSGTYLFERLHQVTPTAAPTETLNNVFTPSDLKLRNSIGWSRGTLGATVFVNYVDSYKDRRSGYQHLPVSSWTTLDLSLRYDVPAAAGSLLRGLALGFNVQNLMDREPPFVNQGIGVNMDPTNANPVGRYLSVSAIKRW